MPPKNVAILLFEGVEVLDFAGPFEVFAVTGRRSASPAPFNVYTIAESPAPVLAVNGLSVNPAYTLATCPPPHILIIPGGVGTRKQMHNAELLDWIAARAKNVDLLLSVCTGALLLAKAGLLDGLSATTHHAAISLLKEIAPRTTIHEDRKFVDNGRVILSAGISAGIEMSLHTVARLLGDAQAAETASHMEYDWRR